MAGSSSPNTRSSRRAWPTRSVRPPAHWTARTSTRYAPIIAAAELLLRANMDAAGTIRPGVSTDDLFLAIAGLWQIDADSDWKPRLTRLLDVVMDGLRAGAPATQGIGLSS